MRADLDEEFSGEELDPDLWFPYYLPHWSSRAESAATYSVRDGELTLSIPPDQPEWSAGLHEEPLRVSCIQSGSMTGQQPFRPDLVVREEHPAFWGYIPHFGQLEITMRGTISPRSMFAFWLSGIEDRPEHSGEICVVEIFGAALGEGTADVGMGVHQFRDPALREEFATERLAADDRGLRLPRQGGPGRRRTPGDGGHERAGPAVRRMNQGSEVLAPAGLPSGQDCSREVVHRGLHEDMTLAPAASRGGGEITSQPHGTLL